MLMLMPGKASIPANCSMPDTIASTFKASKAPQIAIGTVSSMISASRKLSNWADSTRKITTSANARVSSIAEPSVLNWRDSPA